MALRTICRFGMLAGAAFALSGCMEGSGRQQARVAPQVDRIGFGFYFMDEGHGAKLAYGQANSDNVGLMLQCRKGSGAVEITEATGAPRSPLLTLVSSGQRATLDSHIEDGEGSPVLVAHVRADAPPMAAFRRSGVLEVVRSDGRYPIHASADDRVLIDRFFTACQPR